jgi:mRNA interferase MazF
MARGDIIYVDLPQPAGPTGHEQIGIRPVLVVHDDATSGVLSVIVIIPFTATLTAQRYPHTILVQPSPQNGLTAPSVLLVFQLRAIDRTRFKNTIGHLEPNIMQLVEDELRRMLGL